MKRWFLSALLVCGIGCGVESPAPDDPSEPEVSTPAPVSTPAADPHWFRCLEGQVCASARACGATHEEFQGIKIDLPACGVDLYCCTLP